MLHMKFISLVESVGDLIKPWCNITFYLALEQFSEVLENYVIK